MNAQPWGTAVDSAASVPALTAARPGDGDGMEVVFDAAGAYGNRGLPAFYLHKAVDRQVESIPVRYDARASAAGLVALGEAIRRRDSGRSLGRR